MQFVYVKDLVAAMLKAVESPSVVGHAFNIANPRALTQAEFIELLAAAAGKETKVVRIPRERILRAGGHPMGPHLYFGVYFDLAPITMLVNKAQRMLAFKPCPMAEGLKETYRGISATTSAPRSTIASKTSSSAWPRSPVDPGCAVRAGRVPCPPAGGKVPLGGASCRPSISSTPTPEASPRAWWSPAGRTSARGRSPNAWSVFRSAHDHFRSAVVNEPRGSDALVGALLCEPVDPPAPPASSSSTTSATSACAATAPSAWWPRWPTWAASAQGGTASRRPSAR